MLWAKGGRYLLIPETTFWWLDHYKDFKKYLDERGRRVHGDAYCVIYRLAQPGPRP
jgi:hypothetical protein